MKKIIIIFIIFVVLIALTLAGILYGTQEGSADRETVSLEETRSVQYLNPLVDVIMDSMPTPSCIRISPKK